MNHLINETVVDLINNGKLSIPRIKALAEVKEFIDRISSKHYIDTNSILDIETRFGTKPSILTWGDYFQSEMAYSLLSMNDEEFFTSVETVKYDMMSSYIIFSEQSGSFFKWVDSLNVGDNSEDLSEEELEHMHLKVLKIYYTELGINGNFTEAEMAWYWSFKTAAAI